jgi:hypothetical protein
VAGFSRRIYPPRALAEEGSCRQTEIFFRVPRSRAFRDLGEDKVRLRAGPGLENARPGAPRKRTRVYKVLPLTALTIAANDSAANFFCSRRARG